MRRRPLAFLARLSAGRRRVLYGGAAALAAASFYVGASTVPSGGGETRSHGANLWIDPDGGGCDREAARGEYRDAAACGSAQDAYAAASCGDVVRYRPGAGYGSLTIASGAKSCGASGRIVFAPEDDAPNTLARQSTVVIARIEIQVSDCWCEIRDIDTFSGATTGGTVEVDGGDGPPVSADVVLRRIDTRTFWLPARDVEIHGGSAGGFNACSDGDGGLQDAVQIWQSGNPAQPPRDILIDGIYIHDMGATATCDDHSDAIQMLCGTNITIRNSRFVNGPDEDIIGRPFRCPLENIVIENNMLGTTGGYQNITIGNGDVCSNIVIRNNSAAESVNLSCSAGGSDNRHYNNIASNCIIENAASSNNVHTGTVGCGTNARHCTPTYAHANHATTADQHLAANDTCAKDHGTPDAPKHDYDGDPRPPDNTTIGADEPESEAD